MGEEQAWGVTGTCSLALICSLAFVPSSWFPGVDDGKGHSLGTGQTMRGGKGLWRGQQAIKP